MANREKSSQRREARLVTVTGDDGDRRLDNFLLSQLKGVPRSRVYRMIRSGEVRVNKGRARPDRRLIKGDKVRLPPFTLEQKSGPVSRSESGSFDWLEDRLVYEDHDVLVINKPSGLAVHGGSGIRHGVIEMLRAARPHADQYELVHRLDRDTSGCLLIAKRRSALRKLHEFFRSGEVNKEYTALLIGNWKGGNLNVDAPLITSERRNGERHVRVGDAGKEAFTRFIPERHFRDGQLTRIDLGTGRTHQIRVHAAHIGYPVAGDNRYCDLEDPFVSDFGLKRLFLHASTLVFESPKGDRVIRAESPLDADLVEVLNRIPAR